MMRLMTVVGTLLLSTLLVGCASDTHEDLIKQTLSAMQLAGTEVDNITNRVNDAVKKVEKGEATKLDFAEATKATEKLKAVGEEFQIIKRRIEQVRSQISDDERKKNAIRQKDHLNDEFKSIMD